MRIHFGIYHFTGIKWPNRCLCCGGKIDRWIKAKGNTTYDSNLEMTFRYFIPMLTLRRPQRSITISYPVCKEHHFPGANGLLIDKVEKDYVELSIPEGEYASDFALLNHCHIFNGHLLMQDIDSVEIATDETSGDDKFGNERTLCPDESCIGIIENGKCTECSKKV